MPQVLDASKLIATIERLEKRIVERFPSAGLSKVAGTLTQISHRSAGRAAAIRRPQVLLRLLALLLVLAMLGLVAFIITRSTFRLEGEGWQMMQGIEASMSSLVFLGGATYFVVSLERRIKRKRALSAIQELRGLAHIIDMHQLVKDPERAFRKAIENTASSPRETLTPFLLGRYLDYCSELFSLTSKVCVLYGQDSDDEVVLGAVDEIEDLTGGMARRVWQKIMLLDNMEAREERSPKLVGVASPVAVAQ